MNTKLLRELREASGLTFQEIAKRAGYAVQTCWNAEQGRVSAETHENILAVLVAAVEQKRAEADELLAKVAAA